jgi:septal ring factor EnvC (AmiA/AmiB activator)
MRLLVFVLCLHVVLFGATSVDRKITSQQKNLTSKTKVERDISRKLSDVADDILREEKRLRSVINEIKALGKNIRENEKVVKDKEVNLIDLSKQNDILLQKKKELEERIVKIIAEDFSFYLIRNKDHQDNYESILVDEVLEKMGVIVKKEFARLSTDYNTISKKIDVQSKQINEIKDSIKSLEDKKEKQSNLKKEKERTIVKLGSKRIAYRKSLEKIAEERRELRATLAKLKIIKVSEEEAQKEKLLAQQSVQKVKRVDEKMTVRQIGSSYQGSHIKRYRGKKTIAPLENFTVKRKFGNYMDPIYKIKIFNESVILASKEKNAKVQNVLNGKVVYAKDTAILNNVVIVENSYGIHTIYAHLTQLAPTIRVGMKIKKGYILGRIEDDLSFEVTQKSFHLDPLELINF